MMGSIQEKKKFEEFNDLPFQNMVFGIVLMPLNSVFIQNGMCNHF